MTNFADDQGLTELPLLLFSPGLSNSRTLYSALAASISSRGLNVVTIDHPYDAPVVKFPDGSIITAANISTNSQILKALDVRSQDVAFLVSELLHPQQRILPHHSVHEILIAGHSLGGATAAIALPLVPQLSAGANLNGTFFGKVTEKTTTFTKPFLLFEHDNKTDETWTCLYPRLLGAKTQVVPLVSQHGTFTDVPYLIDVWGLRNILPKVVASLLGTIDGFAALNSITQVVVAWFSHIGGTNGNSAVVDVQQVVDKNKNLVFLRSQKSESWQIFVGTHYAVRNGGLDLLFTVFCP